MWLCTTWQLNWDAIGAIATLGATLVALGFGMRDPFNAWRAKKRGRALAATALIHPVQMAKNRCIAVAKMLEGDVEKFRGTLREMGAAMLDPTVDALKDRRQDAELFGDEVAAMCVYGISMMEEIRSFATWLSKIEPPNDAQWDDLKLNLGTIRECAAQATTALRQMEIAAKVHVPKEVMVLRFGPP
jgi:hypothetical protein